MAKMRRYQCPECEGQFDYLHHPNVADDPAPRFCPLCGYDTETDELQEAVTSPNLLKGAARNVDGIWKAEQAGAEFRAQMADDPSLKISDMRDAAIGETTAVPVNNSVTQVMAAAPQGTFGFVDGSQAGLGFSQAAHTGVAPNMGARAIKALRIQHSEYSTTSENPAKETQMPGYRRRA